MSKYIEADALIGNLKAALAVYKRNAKYDETLLPYIKELKQELKIVNSAPTIELVTCKNCRYRKMKRTTFRGEPFIYYRCELLEREVEDDEFCSWGDE